LGHASEIGIPVKEGRFPTYRLDEADEVAYLSSVTEVTPVIAVGERSFEPGPVTARLARAYQDELASIV